MRAWLALCALYWLGLAQAKRVDTAVVDPLSRRSALDKNFMRFGRSSPPFEESADDGGPKEGFAGAARGKQDGFARDGRDKEDGFVARFGRAGAKDFARPGRGKDDFMRFGRTPHDDTDVFSRARRGKQDNFMRFGRVPKEDFDEISRFARGKQDDFMRFGRRPHDDGDVFFTPFSYVNDFFRSARGKQDNFIRFGRKPKGDVDIFFENKKGKQKDFMRFDRNPQDDVDIFFENKRGKQDDFMRFGRKPKDDVDIFFDNKRGKQDNFMRFGRTPQEDVSDFFRSGRGKQDNFMRFGRKPKNDVDIFFGNKRGKQDNFMRFGRTPQEDVNDFFRSSRGKQDNFMRFGRNPQDDVDIFFDPYHYDKDKETAGNDNSINHGEKLEDGSDINMKNKYLERDSRAKQDNFMRFGKSLREDYEKSFPLAGRSSSDILRFGRLKPDYYTIFEKSYHSPVEQSSVNADDQFERERKSKDPNLVRFGRKPPSNDNSFIRFGRSHNASDEGKRVLEHGKDTSQDKYTTDRDIAERGFWLDGNEEFDLQRVKRSPSHYSSTPAPFTEKDASSESDYVVRKLKFGSSSVPELQSSLLSAGIPNVIVGPEFSLLPDLNPPPSMRNIKTGDKSFLRLG